MSAVSGPATVNVPRSGNNTYNYSVSITDQYGQPMAEGTSWSVNAVCGVSISPNPNPSPNPNKNGNPNPSTQNRMAPMVRKRQRGSPTSSPHQRGQ